MTIRAALPSDAGPDQPSAHCPPGAEGAHHRAVRVHAVLSSDSRGRSARVTPATHPEPARLCGLGIPATTSRGRTPPARWRNSLAALSLCSAASLSFPAEAQDAPQCDDRAKVAAWLASEFGETPAVRALDDTNQRVLEFFRNDATGTWTLLATAPDKRACLVASGDVFEDVPAPKPGVPS